MTPEKTTAEEAVKPKEVKTIYNIVIDYVETEPGGPKALKKVELDHVETKVERKARTARLKQAKKAKKAGYPVYDTDDKNVLRKRKALNVLSVFTKIFRPLWIISLILGIVFVVSGPMIMILDVIVTMFLAIVTVGLYLLAQNRPESIISEELAGGLVVVGIALIIIATVLLILDITFTIIKSVIKNKLKQIAKETENGKIKKIA